METKKPGWLALIALGLLTLPVLYVGAYFALVRPIPPRPAIFAPPRPNTPGYPAAIQSAAVWVFHPIHLADRKLRPKVWGTDW